MGIIMNNPIMYSIRGDLSIRFDYLVPMWERFATYLRKDEIEFLEELKEKKALDLTLEEVEKYKGIKEQMEVSKLLSKYNDHNCTQKEHDIVANFFEKYSLNAFMRDRLTEEEKNVSYKLVSSLEANELEVFIKNNEDNFDNLSILETYTFYLANSRLKGIRDREFTERLRREAAERDQALLKSLARDYGFRFF